MYVCGCRNHLFHSAYTETLLVLLTPQPHMHQLTNQSLWFPTVDDETDPLHQLALRVGERPTSARVIFSYAGPCGDRALGAHKVPF